MVDIAELARGPPVADLSKLVNALNELTVLEAAELTKILEESGA